MVCVREIERVVDCVTRCWSNKVSQMLPKVAQIVATTVYRLSDVLHNSPKVTSLSGLLL